MSIQCFKDVEAFEKTLVGPVEVARAVLATAILGPEGAVAGNVLWRVAFPAKSRGGNATVVM